MTSRTGIIVSTAITGVAVGIMAMGIWLADREEASGENASPSATTAHTTAATSSTPRPPETVLIVTLPPATEPAATSTAPTAPTTTGMVPPTQTTTTTTRPPPPPYQSAAQQVDFYVSGEDRQRVVDELQTLTPFMVSVDQLDARHAEGGGRFVLPGDGSAPRFVGPAIVVSLTSDFSGDDAVAEEAWIVTKYFAGLWEVGNFIRTEIDHSGPLADDLNTHVGYGLEVKIGRHTYSSTGPVMAAIADVNLGFADWERLATVPPSE
jgi:hypothetical protein